MFMKPISIGCDSSICSLIGVERQIDSDAGLREEAEELRARRGQTSTMANTNAAAISPANIANAIGLTNLICQVAHPNTAKLINNDPNKHKLSTSVRPVLILICEKPLSP
jgi:hypothetical protein